VTPTWRFGSNASTADAGTRIGFVAELVGTAPEQARNLLTSYVMEDATTEQLATRFKMKKTTFTTFFPALKSKRTMSGSSAKLNDILLYGGAKGSLKPDNCLLPVTTSRMLSFLYLSQKYFG
jgi:hypothetical protein